MTNIIIKNIENLQKKNIYPNFKTGDTICVNFKPTEKSLKNRTFNFEGTVISIKYNGINSTCTLRKTILGEGVEKTFFLNSPTINWIKIKKKGIVSKSKIYYIRKLKGKAAKIKENLKKDT